MTVGRSLRQIAIVIRKELKDSLRDRRALWSIIFSIVIGPVLIGFMMNKLADRQREAESLRIPMVGMSRAPALVNWLNQQGGRMPVEDSGMGSHRHNWLEAHVLRQHVEAIQIDRLRESPRVAETGRNIALAIDQVSFMLDAHPVDVRSCYNDGSTAYNSNQSSVASSQKGQVVRMRFTASKLDRYLCSLL